MDALEVAGVEKDEDLCHLLLDDLWEFLPQASLLKLQTLFNVGRYVGSGEQFDASVTNAIIMAKLYLLNRPFSFESAVAAAISLIPTRTGGDPIPERLRVLLSMFNIDPKLAYLVDVDYNGDCPLNSVTGARDVIALSRSQEYVSLLFGRLNASAMHQRPIAPSHSRCSLCPVGS